MFSHVVVTDFKESFSKDFESEFGLGGVRTLILSVDLTGNSLGVDSLTIDEVTVFDVEVDVGYSQS